MDRICGLHTEIYLYKKTIVTFGITDIIMFRNIGFIIISERSARLVSD